MNAVYTRPAILLHWLMAVLIAVTFPLGLYMSGLHLSPHKLQLYAYHKWIGICLLSLLVLRAFWRITHQPPALTYVLPRWQERVASLTHFSLYLLLCLIPITGWMMSSALGFPVVLFGILPLPDLVGTNHALGIQLKHIHSFLNYGLLSLVMLHLVAVVQHQFILRDGVLWRMWSWRKPC